MAAWRPTSFTTRAEVSITIDVYVNVNLPGRQPSAGPSLPVPSWVFTIEPPGGPPPGADPLAPCDLPRHRHRQPAPQVGAVRTSRSRFPAARPRRGLPRDDRRTGRDRLGAARPAGADARLRR